MTIIRRAEFVGVTLGCTARIRGLYDIVAACRARCSSSWTLRQLAAVARRGRCDSSPLQLIVYVAL
jgi:hypothetical protein